MTYDCFTFNDEFKLLEIRLNELWDVVDKFVIVEGNQTFSGQTKPLYFKKNYKKFSKFKKKIIHVEVDLNQAPIISDLQYVDQTRYSQHQDAWAREFFQRNSILKGLVDCRPNDVILISDVDEIPNKNVLKKLRTIKGVVALEQQFYYHYFNCLSPEIWRAAKAVKFSELSSPQQIRDESQFKVLRNAGWHFTYFGKPADIAKKISSFSHQEYNTSEYTQLPTVDFKLMNGIDLFDRPIKYIFKKNDNELPAYILKNRTKFRKDFANFVTVQKNTQFRNEIYQLQKKINTLAPLEPQLKTVQEQLNTVLNSRGWKVLSFYRDTIKPKFTWSKKMDSQVSHVQNSNYSKEFARTYLREHKLRKLHIGCGSNIMDSWLNSDLHEDTQRIILDATKPFPFPDESFDYIYSEHTIEHLDYREGNHMLSEAFRVLKVGGKIRTATPNITFLTAFYNQKLNKTQKQYIAWAVNEFMSDIGINRASFVVNNFVRSWGHKFIYDIETLKASHAKVGFKNFQLHTPGQSKDRNLKNLEKHWQDMNKDFYKMETMILEATKPGRKK